MLLFFIDVLFAAALIDVDGTLGIQELLTEVSQPCGWVKEIEADESWRTLCHKAVGQSDGNPVEDWHDIAQLHEDIPESQYASNSGRNISRGVFEHIGCDYL